MITRPGVTLPGEAVRRATTASQSAVPRVRVGGEAGERGVGVGRRALEKPVERDGLVAERHTSTWSLGPFAATNARAAAVASRERRAGIDCERSTASTTLLPRPRLTALEAGDGHAVLAQPRRAAPGRRDDGHPDLRVAARVDARDPHAPAPAARAQGERARATAGTRTSGRRRLSP